MATTCHHLTFSAYLMMFLSFSSSIPPMFLPLKISSPPITAKLPFHHNITLTVTLAVGTPPQNVSMVVDTGSELSWLHCKSSPNFKTTFDPLGSSSYSPVPCSSSTCTTRTRDLIIPVSCDSKKLCHAILSYADASSSEGNLASDVFRIGAGGGGTIFGCMDSGYTSNSEEDSKTSGVLGMNQGALSFVSQMKVSKFSYCISDRDQSGVLLLGESKSLSSWLKPLSYTPLVRLSTPLPYYDRVAYTVQLQGIQVAHKSLPLPKSVFLPDHTGAGQTMVDSGTQFTYLLGPVYTALRNEFLLQTKGILKVLDDPNYVFQGVMDLCYLVPAAQEATMPELPTVSLMFRGAQMLVPGDRLLYRVPNEVRGGNNHVHCFSFGNSDLLGIEAYVIGHHHQHNMWVEFDIRNSRLGFAAVSCDMATRKLGKMGPAS